MPFSTGSFFNRSSAGGSDSSSNDSRGYPRGSRGINGNGEGSRRENIVVSSVEISRLFDSVKSLGEELKKQNQSIEILADNVQQCTAEIAALKQELTDLRENQDHVPRDVRNLPSFSGPIPKALKDDVHLAHNQQNEMQFRGKEGIESPHNTAVRAFLVQELTKEENGYDKSIIMRAVTRYFETKRQQYLDNLPERKEATEKKLKDKILTSRRRRLYVQRMKVANEVERERLAEIDHNYMSDEEDGDEEGVWVVRSPFWRSAELSSLLEALQKTVKEKDSTSKHPKNRRIRGANSTRKLPSKPPGWAIAQPRQTAPTRQPTSSRDMENEKRPSLTARQHREPATRKHQGTRTQHLEDEGSSSSSRSYSPRSPRLKGKRPHDLDEEQESSYWDEESDEGMEGEFSDDGCSDTEPAYIKKKKLSFSQVQQELAHSPDGPKTPEQMPALKTSTPINGDESVKGVRKPGRRQNNKKTKK